MELSTAIHDLRAPLNGMVLNLELLKGRLEADVDVAPGAKTDYLRYVGKVQKDIGRLKELLNAMQIELSP